MERKLIRQGLNGYTVYLPAKWIKEHDLTKGSIVALSLEDEAVIIRSKEQKAKKKEIVIQLTSSVNATIRAVLSSAYRFGYSTLRLHYLKKDDLATISTIVERLMGYEIISNSDFSCVIENVTEPDASKHHDIFLKLLYSLSDFMHQIRQQLIQSGNQEYILELEKRIQRYDNFCRRVAPIEHPSLAPLYWSFYAELMHGQREIYRLSTFLSKESLTPKKEILHYYDELVSLFEKLKQGFLKKDIASLEEIQKEEKNLIYEKGYFLLETVKGKQTILIFRIASAIRKLYLSVSPLIGLFLLK